MIGSILDRCRIPVPKFPTAIENIKERKITNNININAGGQDLIYCLCPYIEINNNIKTTPSNMPITCLNSEISHGNGEKRK